MFKFKAPEATAQGLCAVTMSAEKLSESGIPLNVKDGRVLISPPEHHCMIYGVSGKGKTRRILYPTVTMSARAGHSMIIADCKGEIYRHTASELKKCGVDTKVINLRTPMYGNRYNPFALVERAYKAGNKPRAAMLLRDLAEIITGGFKADKDAYWQLAACDAFVGFAQLLLEKGYHLDFGSIHAIVEDYIASEYKHVIKRVINKDCKESKRRLSTVTSLVADTTLGCVISELEAALTTYTTQEDVCDLLSESEIDITDLVTRPTAVFLICPDESVALYPIASVFIAQAYAEMLRIADTREDGKLPIKIDYILDEFGNFTGSDWAAKLTAARSRGIRFILALQTLSQLVDRYGASDASTLTSNCRTLVYMGGRDIELMHQIDTFNGEASGIMGLATLQPGNIVVLGDSGIPTRGYLPDWSEWNVTEKARLMSTKRQLKKRDYPTLLDVLGLSVGKDGFYENDTDEEIPF